MFNRIQSYLESQCYRYTRLCEVHVNSAKNQYASSSGVSIKNIEMFTKLKLTLNLGNFFIL